MATFTFPIPERTMLPGHQAILEFHFIVKRMVAKFRAPAQSPRHTVEAIETLSNCSGNPDMRDWAERYLCGMVDGDARSYLASRKWQS